MGRQTRSFQLPCRRIPPPLLNHPPDIGRQRTLKKHPFPRARVREPQRPRMQRVPRAYLEAIIDKLLVLGGDRAFDDLVAAVGIVVEERVTRVLHVHTDLVGPPGLQLALDQSNIMKPLQHTKVRNRFLAVISFGIRRHDLAESRVSPDVRANRTGVEVKVPPDKRYIQPVYGMVEKLLRQMRAAALVLGQNQEPAGVFIDARDEAETGELHVRELRLLLF